MVSNKSAAGKMLVDIHNHIGWMFGVGIVLLLLGCAGLYFKLLFTETVMRYLGGLLVAAAIIAMIGVYRAEKWLMKFWDSLTVVVYLAGGLLMLIFPDESSNLVFMLLGMILVVMGAFRIIIALQAKANMKLWILVILSGLVSISLGCMLLAQWPWPAIDVLGLFVSVELVLQGLAMLYIGFVAKSAGSDSSPTGGTSEPATGSTV